MSQTEPSLSRHPASRTSSQPRVIGCFGEALWDILPEGMFIGGAPLNVAYHLRRQNLRARLVSALGNDFLGAELGRRLTELGIDTRCVARIKNRPTGTVRARLDGEGKATYRIARDVAWDRIESSTACLRLPSPAALVFGTLALRGTPNREVLARLVVAWPDAWRVLDLNLRQPFVTKTAIGFALDHAQFVKLNDEELQTLTGRPTRNAEALARAARRLRDAHGLTRICVTAGSRGAGLLWDDRWHWEPSRPIQVRDTVGAGDSFLAAFLAATLARGETPAAALASACRMGEFVASQAGATPAYRCDRNGRVLKPSR